MSDETTPSRPSLATFLQGQPNPAAGAQSAAAGTPPQGGESMAHGTTHAIETVEVPTAASDTTAAGAPSDAPDDDNADTPAIAAPSFMRGSRPAVAQPRATPRWQWLVVAVLALLLTVQILVADRARLAADASTRPLVSGLCAVLRCSLPAWHEPSAYAMLSREIRPVPGLPGVLQVQASFRNEARWAQAWPALNLALSDADGRVIGRRTLQPAEYLGPGADPLARLEPGQSAQVSFRLREPAAGTVAFSFEFQ